MILTYLKVVTGIKLLRALLAGEPWHSSVDLKVLSQVGLLLKGLAALVADEGPVIGMRKQVVDERMPIRKNLSAARVGAEEQLDHSLDARLAVLDHDV